MFQVTIHSAKDLRSADSNGYSGSGTVFCDVFRFFSFVFFFLFRALLLFFDSHRPDPYALVFVGRNKPKKTKIIKKNLNPVWEETFEFPFTRHDKTLQVDESVHEGSNSNGCLLRARFDFFLFFFFLFRFKSGIGMPLAATNSNNVTG